MRCLVYGVWWLLSFCVVAAGASEAAGQIMDELSDRYQIPGGSLFKLHINYEGFPTDLDLTDHRKLPTKVDPKIVSEIHQLRMSLPNWHGTHSLTPGVQASAH